MRLPSEDGKGTDPNVNCSYFSAAPGHMLCGFCVVRACPICFHFWSRGPGRAGSSGSAPCGCWLWCVLFCLRDKTGSHRPLLMFSCSATDVFIYHSCFSKRVGFSAMPRGQEATRVKRIAVRAHPKELIAEGGRPRVEARSGQSGHSGRWSALGQFPSL